MLYLCSRPYQIIRQLYLFHKYLQVKVPKYSRTVLKFSTAFFDGNSIFTRTKPAVLQAVLVNIAILTFYFQ